MDHFALKQRFFQSLYPSDDHISGVHPLVDLVEKVRCDAVGIQHYAGAGVNLRQWLKETTSISKETPSGLDLLTHLLYQHWCDIKWPSRLPASWRESLSELPWPDVIRHIKAAKEQLDKPDELMKMMHQILDLLAKSNTPLPYLEQPKKADLSDDKADNMPDESPSKKSQPQKKQNQTTYPNQDDMGLDDVDNSAEISMNDQVPDHFLEKSKAGPSWYDQNGQRPPPQGVGRQSALPKAGWGHNHPPLAPIPYHVFTRAYDEVIKPTDLLTPQELRRLSQSLDDQLHYLKGRLTRYARMLQRWLMAERQIGWSYDHEEGDLSPPHLSRIVVNPIQHRAYRQPIKRPWQDTVVSLLVDNSGSMRGRPIRIAALSTNILAKTLEKCGIKVEILGFTTKAWKGGQSRLLWVQQETPPAPGRLNDIRHIIYKSADTSWKKARFNLGLMLFEGLLKENIDGEALQWAYRRLVHRPEERKLMIVISDGAPVDDATLAANGSAYLDHHLQTMVQTIEQEGLIDLLAIGIGHDVSRTYKRAITIHQPEQLGTTLFQGLIQLLYH